MTTLLRAYSFVNGNNSQMHLANHICVIETKFQSYSILLLESFPIFKVLQGAGI